MGLLTGLVSVSSAGHTAKADNVGYNAFDFFSFSV
jgi:hypothetical protein